MNGPRATEVFLLVSGILFAGLLALLGWRSGTSQPAAWLAPVAVVVGIAVVVAAVIFSKGVGEGRL